MIIRVSRLPALVQRGARSVSVFAGASSLSHSHRERKLLKFPTRHVYNVVSGVSEYKHFVPWCVDSVILLNKGNYIEAELAVGFQLFAERYISRVTLEQDRRVLAEAKSTQLFHYLNTEWLFAPGPDAASTWCSFKVDFAFQSFLYARASSLFFDEVVNRMVSAFERRCAEKWALQAAASRQVLLAAAGQEAAARPAGAAAAGKLHAPARPAALLHAHSPPLSAPLSAPLPGPAAALSADRGTSTTAQAHRPGSMLSTRDLQQPQQQQQPALPVADVAAAATAAAAVRRRPVPHLPQRASIW